MYNNEEEIARIFLLKVLPNFQKKGAWQDLNFEREGWYEGGSDLFEGRGVAIFKSKIN